MNFIEWLFAILDKFVKIDEKKFIRLKNEGESWYMSLIEKNAEEQNPFEKFLTKYGELWWVQTAFACTYIFAIKQVAEFLQPAQEEDIDLKNFM